MGLLDSAIKLVATRLGARASNYRFEDTARELASRGGPGQARPRIDYDGRRGFVRLMAELSSRNPNLNGLNMELNAKGPKIRDQTTPNRTERGTDGAKESGPYGPQDSARAPGAASPYSTSMPRSTAPGGTIGATGMGNLDQWTEKINEYSQRTGVHPAVFAVAMMQESGGDPTRVSGVDIDPYYGSPLSGGLFMDHIRGRGAGRRGDQYSVEEQFERAAREFQQYWNQNEGLPERDRVLRTIAQAQRFRNYDNPNSAEYGAYAGWYDRLAPHFQSGRMAPTLTPESPGYQAQQLVNAVGGLGRGINQIQLGIQGGLTQAEAEAYCGPAAAAMLAAVYGNSIPPQEVARYARRSPWTPQAGMGGVQAFQNLVHDMAGLQTQAAPVDWNRVIEMVQGGNPVVLSSPAHYWQVTGYNPQTGQFDYGESAAILRALGGRTQLGTNRNEYPTIYGQPSYPDTMIWVPR
jgi:hypothetical protein